MRFTDRCPTPAAKTPGSPTPRQLGPWGGGIYSDVMPEKVGQQGRSSGFSVTASTSPRARMAARSLVSRVASCARIVSGDEPVAAECLPKFARMLVVADDLDFDEIKRIKMPQFFRGRVALVGDAD